MKGAVAGQQFTGPSDVLDGIQALLDEIQRSELEHIFDHWIERVRWVLDAYGDSLHEQILDYHHSLQVRFDQPVAITY
jgi:hypothetical protein